MFNDKFLRGLEDTASLIATCRREIDCLEAASAVLEGRGDRFRAAVALRQAASLATLVHDELHRN
jgi:hypothetical protein